MCDAAESGLAPIGVARQVAEGIFRVRLPLDLQQDHVNVWVLEGDSGITVVDTGVGTSQTRALWRDVLERQFGGRPLRRVICTHWHPDHMGCAAWLVDRAEETLWITRREWQSAHRAAGRERARYLEDEAEFLEVTGCDSGVAEKILKRAGYITARFLPPPDRYRRIYGGRTLDVDGDRWRTILGEGHSPEHVALHSEARNLLIVGDMVLPDTVTFVGVESSEGLESNPIAAYLQSLERLKSVPEDVLVLPSHGEPFVGLHARIAELEARNHDRLARVLEALEGTMSPAEMVSALSSRQPSASRLYLGLRAALAGLNYHTASGSMRRWREGGVLRFARS